MELTNIQSKSAYSNKDSSEKNRGIKLYSKVELYDYEMEENLELVIVPQKESDIINGKISVESDLGKNLLGQQEGDIIEIDNGVGKSEKIYKYKIVSWE